MFVSIIIDFRSQQQTFALFTFAIVVSGIVLAQRCSMTNPKVNEPNRRQHPALRVDPVPAGRVLRQTSARHSLVR
jgi:hypothetical protein